jgi:hypothetical protein
MRPFHLALFGALPAIPSLGQAPGRRTGRRESGARSRVGSCAARLYPGRNHMGRLLGRARRRLRGRRCPRPGRADSAPPTQRWGGLGSAFVNGRRVPADPNLNRILGSQASGSLRRFGGFAQRPGGPKPPGIEKSPHGFSRVLCGSPVACMLSLNCKDIALSPII